MKYSIMTHNLNKKEADALYNFLVGLQGGELPIKFSESKGQ